MTHDEMMSLLANTLADAAGSSGCLPILDCFSPHPGEEVTVSIAQRFDGMQLGAGAVEQVVAEYGLERTKYVLAAAIQTRDGDGRISRTNRKWADSIRTIKDMDRRGFDRSC